MRKRIISLLLAIVMCLSAIPVTSAAEPAKTESPGFWKAAPVETVKPRVIATNDAECDDMNSFLRFLLYSDMYDIEGLVYTSSTFHWEGGVNAEGETVEPYRWMPVGWMEDWIDDYAKYYENYSKHGDFATPEELKSVVAEGNIKFYNELYGSTDGSNLIKDALLDESDERPVHLLAWGGTSSIAQALKDIEDEYKDDPNWDEIYKAVSDKAIICMLTTQDDTYKSYISQNWPEIQMLHTTSFWTAYAYGWENGIPDELVDVFRSEWMQKNIIFNHGDYMDHYFTWGNQVYLEGELEENQFGTNEDLLENWWGAGFMGTKEQYDFVSEGDTPTFLNLIEVGLRSTEDPGYGGWGGRYVPAEYSGNPEANYYKDVADPNTEDGIEWINNQITEGKEVTRNALARWSKDSMNDFAARADWLIAENYEDANHAPVISVEEGLDFLAEPGATIELHGKAEDPDGDQVNLDWMYYWDAGTYGKDVPFTDDGTGTITFTVPEDAKDGDTIHMILTGRDDGEHNLARYQRVIVTVTDDPSGALTEEQLETIAEQSKKDKANVILTNDGECDDMDSMLRYLNYANEFNTKAVIISSSTYHWAGGTIIDPKTRQPAEYDEEVHGTKDVDPFEYDPTPEDPDNGDEYQALRYLQSRWTGMAWYDHFYDGYEEAYETLKAYDDSYPSPDELRDVTYVGNIKYKGEMLEETEGSVAIEDLILNNPDGEPLYVLLWGGCNTVARALKSIEEDYRDTEDWDRIYNKICDEVVFYMILNQDNTYADYISKNWPDTKFVHNSGQFWSFAYMKSRTPEEYYDDVFSKTWSDTIAEIGSPLLTTYLLNASGWDLRHIGEDVETNPGNETNPFYTWNNTEDTEAFYNPDKNPYNAWAGDEAVVATWGESENRGSAEPVHQDCKVCCVNEDGSKKTNATKGEQDYFISEGDSPSFFFLLNNGLRSNEDPTWGGWGGRFVQESDRYWTDKGCADWNPYSQKEDSVYPQTRWFPDIQEDFSARAQWTVTEDGNRNPMSGVMNGLDLTAKPGETLTLNGVAYDPNGDGLSYKWWQYFEVDTYDGELDSKLEMSGADTKDLTVTIPEDAEDGDTIHLIFEAKDDNELPMKAYKRVVITVKAEDPTDPTGGLTEEQLDAIAAQSEKQKVNTILTTDGEPDDMDSMLRYLTYANEFNTKAIVFTSSQSHWSGGTILDPATGKPVVYDEELHGPVNPDAAEQGDSYVDPFEYDPTPDAPDSGDEYMALRYKQYRFNGFGWFEQFLQDYEKSYAMLSSHDDSYPTAEELKEIFAVGNIKYKSEMEEVTEGSELIREVILNNPAGEPLVVQAWGGTNTLARALKSIEEEYKGTDQWDDIYNKISSELSCYMINTQDTTYADYISVNWPGVCVYQSGLSFLVYVRGSAGQVGGQDIVDKYFSAEWCDTLMEIGSPLLSQYLTVGGDWSLVDIGKDAENPYYTWKDTEHTNGFFDPDYNEYNAFPADKDLIETWGEKAGDGSGNPGEGNGSFYSEGDTPSYLFLIDVGLRSFENPGWGGWGGRFVEKTPGVFACAKDNMNGKESSNWPLGRWAADVQADFSARAQWTVSEDANHNPMSGVMNGLDLTAEPGETLTLNGVAYDPNGDGLSYKWWQYYEADTYDGEQDNALVMSGADTKDLTVTIPEDAEDGDTIHLIFEAKDDNELPMKAYKRVVITVEDDAQGGGGSSSSSSRFSITVTQSEGGTIAPSSATVAKGGSKTFTITADEGWQIADVLVDGKSVGAVSSYTFKNVTEKHTITAMFEPMEGAAGVAGFIDVKASDWFAGAVEYVVNGGLMNGTSKTTFSPMGDTTRGMIVTILYRQAGSPEVESDQSNWWSDARVWAMANGVSDGTNIEKPITREQLAAMLYRYAKLTGEDISGRASLESFQDAGKVSSYAVEALQWNVAEGIVTGKTGGVIDPQAGATRAEAATMFMRFCELTR